MKENMSNIDIRLILPELQEAGGGASGETGAVGERVGLAGSLPEEGPCGVLVRRGSPPAPMASLASEMSATHSCSVPAMASGPNSS